MACTKMKNRLFGTDIHMPCAWCGRTLCFVDATVDHLVPRAFGGRTTLDNVVIACAPCNRRRGAEVSRQVQAQVMPARLPWRLEPSPYGG